VTDLVLAPRPSAVVSANEWTLIAKQAEVLAMSDIIPAAYRRKPANIVVAALTGRAHGWDVMTAMRNGHVVEGTWGLRPEAMLGLVRRAGHSVTAELSPDGAALTGKRADTGDELTLTFTIEDARRAGLANKQVWKNYPQAMCYWRAVGMLCRFLFSDVTLGLMSVEELGAAIDTDGEVVDVGEVQHERVAHAPLSESVMDQFGTACATEGLTTAEVLARAFPDGPPDPLTDAHLPALRDMFKRMVAERATEAESNRRDEIEEGVVVPDDSVPSDPESVRPATRAQVGKIKGEYERLGQPDRTKQLAFTADVVGREVVTHNQLTTDEAHVLIEKLTSLESA
jgi:hypothetical protein